MKHWEQVNTGLKEWERQREGVVRLLSGDSRSAGGKGNEREIREKPLAQWVCQCPTSQYSGEEEGLFIRDNDPPWAAHTTPLMCWRQNGLQRGGARHHPHLPWQVTKDPFFHLMPWISISTSLHMYVCMYIVLIIVIYIIFLYFLYYIIVLFFDFYC